MPNGTLMSLVAYGAQNAHISRNVQYDYETFESESITSNLIITRTADIITPEYLELSLVNPTVSFDELKSNLSGVILNLTIGGSDILNLPIDFLIDLETPDIVDGKLYVNLHFENFIGGLEMIRLQHHEVRFKIINQQDNLNINQYFNSFGIVCKETYLDTQERQQLAQSHGEQTFQQISFVDVVPSRTNINLQSNTFDIRLPFDGPTKGFFIQCANIAQIKQIQITLNGHERTNYNKFLIKTKCKTINSNLLYCPFNPQANWADTTQQSYHGSTNLSRIDSTKIKICLDMEIAHLRVYGLGLNIFRQIGGVGGVAYSHGLYREYIDLTTPILPQTHAHTNQGNQIDQIIYSKPIFKPIVNTDRVFCPLSFEDIPPDAQYVTCTTCKYNFCADIMKTWLGKKAPGQRNCPMCKTKWTSYDLYVNGTEPGSSSESDSNINQLVGQMDTTHLETIANKIVKLESVINQTELVV